MQNDGNLYESLRTPWALCQITGNTSSDVLADANGKKQSTTKNSLKAWVLLLHRWSRLHLQPASRLRWPLKSAQLTTKSPMAFFVKKSSRKDQRLIRLASCFVSFHLRMWRWRWHCGGIRVPPKCTTSPRTSCFASNGDTLRSLLKSQALHLPTSGVRWSRDLSAQPSMWPSCGYVYRFYAVCRGFIELYEA